MKTSPACKSALRFFALVVLLALGTHVTAQTTDPLPSWNDGAAKKAIVEFVQATATQGSPQFVPPGERIATFDQDGTLWVEHPMYSQVMYILERVPALVQAKPELAKVAPFSTVLEVLKGDRAAISKLTLPDLEKLAAATLTGMPVATFQAEAKKWLAEAKGSVVIQKSDPFPYYILKLQTLQSSQGLQFLFFYCPLYSCVYYCLNLTL